MQISTLTQKGQTTIPSEIRKSLGLHSGDKLIFEIKDNLATIKKVDPFDFDYHQSLSNTLSEWNSKTDDEAYDDL